MLTHTPERDRLHMVGYAQENKKQALISSLKKTQKILKQEYENRHNVGRKHVIEKLNDSWEVKDTNPHV